MQVHCTRPTCPRPENHFSDLDDPTTLKTVQQKFCTTCGMPLLLAGRYVPQRLLGQGGFGAAFLARDRYTPKMRNCVVKQFQPSGDLSPDQIQLAQNLFEREAQVLEELGNNHPQIPDLLAFFELDVPTRSPGKSDRFFYLVQEFIDGQNMEQELAQKGKFSEKEILELLIETLKVLRFVHENGSIHRDIKPSNIMRDRNGRIYLLDFGAVKQVTASAGASPGRSTGIYSMGFAPPEQMQGNVVYPATDLYALGVTCITLLTGKEPTDLYDAYNNRWNWQQHASASDRLIKIFDGMLRPSPSDRFQSADEVIAALKASLSATPSPAPAPAPPLPTPQPPLPKSTQPHTSVQAQVAAPPPIPPQTAATVHQRHKPRRPARPFSTLEVIGGAAFTGFESGLAAIAIASFLGTTFLSGSFWLILLGIMAAIVFAQNRRWIERMDLIIIAAVTLGIVMFVPGLSSAVRGIPINLLPTQTIILVAGFVALMAIVIAIIFRLIYNLLSRFL